MSTSNVDTPATSKPHVHVEEESEEARIERLGRSRPERFSSIWQEIGFVFSITVSQLLNEYFVSGFTILLPTVASALNIPASSTTWPASAFSLVISSFLLPMGRIADIYGGFPVYVGGCAWYCVWSLIASFSTNELMLNMCRAIQGLGPAAFLPAGLQLLGSMYRPGPRKNLVFAIYGSMAPLGFFVGFFFAGVSAEYTTWRWYFWIGTILILIVTSISYFCIPSDMAEHKNSGVKMDWLGSFTIISGLILVVFAITDSSHASQGWASPHILVTLILGLIMLGLAFWVEGWVAEQPLLPFSFFQIKYMRPFCVGLLFCYGTLGIYLLYATLFAQNVLGAGPMKVAVWYLPTAIVGGILAITGGYILHLVSPRILMFVTAAAIIIESVLLALAPADAGYWEWIFIPMIMSTLAIDVIFTVATVFFSTTLPLRQQGLAGSLSNVLLQLGIALLLGFAEVIATNTAHQGQQSSYQNVFWFNMSCGIMALLIFMPFVRIKKAKSALTADEREAREGANAEHAQE